MAEEITIVDSMRLVNGTLKVTPPARSYKFDQATALAGEATQIIGTTEETADFGDVTPGFVRITNLDATNYVQAGYATGVYVNRLRKNGGYMEIEAESGITVYLKADTAACNVQIRVFNT